MTGDADRPHTARASVATLLAAAFAGGVLAFLGLWYAWLTRVSWDTSSSVYPLFAALGDPTVVLFGGALLCGVLAGLFGVVGRRRTASGPVARKGVATTAVALGVLPFALLLFVILFFASLSDTM